MTDTLIPVYPNILHEQGYFEHVQAPEVYFTREFITRLIQMERTLAKRNERDGYRLKRENGVTCMVFDDADIPLDDLYPVHRGRSVWVLDTDEPWVLHEASGELVMKGKWPD